MDQVIRRARRVNLLVTSYIERATVLTSLLQKKGIDASVLSKFAVQVPEDQAREAQQIGKEYMKGLKK
jgi:hypothetical protein